MIGNPARARSGDVALADVGQRPDHDMPCVIGPEFRRHGLETPAKEKIQEQRLDDVIPMMPERDLGDAVFGA